MLELLLSDLFPPTLAGDFGLLMTFTALALRPVVGAGHLVEVWAIAGGFPWRLVVADVGALRPMDRRIRGRTRLCRAS